MLLVSGHMSIVGHMTKAIDMTGVIPQWAITDRIRKAREHAGYKQSELATELGISRTVMASIEQGVREPRRGELIAISFATGVDLEWLETGKTPVDPKTDGGNDVRHQGLEPRTHWLRSKTTVASGANVA